MYYTEIHQEFTKTSLDTIYRTGINSSIPKVEENDGPIFLHFWKLLM